MTSAVTENTAAATVTKVPSSAGCLPVTHASTRGKWVTDEGWSLSCLVAEAPYQGIKPSMSLGLIIN